MCIRDRYTVKRSAGKTSKTTGVILTPLSELLDAGVIVLLTSVMDTHSSVAPMLLLDLSRSREVTAWSRSCNGSARKNRAAIRWNGDEEVAPSGFDFSASSTSLLRRFRI